MWRTHARWQKNRLLLARCLLTDGHGVVVHHPRSEGGVPETALPGIAGTNTAAATRVAKTGACDRA
jgi:hypothetical protein